MSTSEEVGMEAPPPPSTKPVEEKENESDLKETASVLNGQESSENTNATTKDELSPQEVEGDVRVEEEQVFEGLQVLPPLQRKDDGTCSSPAASSMTVGLPPIRPAEPTSSLRAALGELVRYAHYTHYRFRLEPPSPTEVVTSPSQHEQSDELKAVPSEEDTTSKKQTDEHPSKHGKHSQSKGGRRSKKKGGGGHNSKNGAAISPSTSLEKFPSIEFTGEDAVITMNHPPLSTHQMQATSGEEKKEQDVTPTTLDDYGDLSTLGPLLQNGCSFRIVLEKYDVAGIRDHVTRLVTLLEGHPPSVMSLMDPEDEKRKDHGTKQAKGEDHLDAKTTDQKGSGETETSSKKEKEESDVKGDETNEDHADKENKTAPSSNEKSTTKTKTPQSASKPKGQQAKEEEPQTPKRKPLPTFSLEKPVRIDGTNIVDYYNLACGEDEELVSSSLDERHILGITSQQENDGNKDSSNNSSEGSASKKSRSKGKNNNHNNGGGANHQSKGKHNHNGASKKNPSKTTGDATTTAEECASWSMQEYTNRLETLDLQCDTKWRVTFSGFNPPPPHRKGLGDLAYLEVTPPCRGVNHLAMAASMNGHGRDAGDAHMHTNGMHHDSLDLHNGGGGVDGNPSETMFLTATAFGFYVNKSKWNGRTKMYEFDPAPADEHCFSHNVLDCLLKASPWFRECWANALAAARERSDIISVCSASDTPLQSLRRLAQRSVLSKTTGVASNSFDSVMFRPSWLVPSGRTESASLSAWKRGQSLNQMHTYDIRRSMEELHPSNGTYAGMDLRAGTERDWNEELQSAREMPCGTLEERIDRARIIHKVLSDFHVAALQGARAIFEGHISPINPNEPCGPRTFVYFFNNIFYSRAVDASSTDANGVVAEDANTFKIASGDSAARKSVIRDAACMSTLHKLDFVASPKSKLYTLANMIVDYMGTRLVCQSMVPGILSGEQCHTLLYGAVANNVPLKRDEETHALLEECIGKGCMVASRAVPETPKVNGESSETSAGTKEAKSDDGTTTVCGPIEVKGIKGSDQRTYVLDLTRLTPRDANWVPASEGGTGKWESQFSGNKSTKTRKNYIPESLEDEEWKMAVLRPELITSLTHGKMADWIKKNDKSLEKGKKEPEQVEEKKESSSNDARDEETSALASSSGNKDTPLAESMVKSTDLADHASLSKVVKQLDSDAEKYMNTLRYNVNVFLPQAKVHSSDEAVLNQLKEDEKRAREAASHLWDTVLPSLTKEIRDSSGHQIPVDGASLTDMLHARGVNCRYLGRLAQLAAAEEDKDAEDLKKSIEHKGDNLTLPRRSMPLCWLELLECEMLARASKHVLDSYLLADVGFGPGHETCQPPAMTISAFLSALLSSGEESAADTEARVEEQEKNEAQSNKGNGPKSNGKKLGSKTMSPAATVGPVSEDDDDMSSLLLSKMGGRQFSICRGRNEVWDDLEKEIGRRFRYTLKLFNSGNGASSTANSKQTSKSKGSRCHFTSLLRRVCQRIGVRLAARNYKLGGKCRLSTASSSFPVSSVDIVDIVPTVKYAAAQDLGSIPSSFGGPGAGSTNPGGAGGGVGAGGPSLHVLLPDAKATLEAAHMYWSAGALSRALDFTHEAASLYQRVTDTPLHASIGRCLDLTSIILFQAKQYDMAISSASRSLGVAVQLAGFDSAEAISAHSTLAHILTNAGDVATGFKHYRAVLYLSELLAGPHYAELPSIYHKIGSMYHENGLGIGALRFYQEAGTRTSCDRMLDCMIAKSTAVVLAALGQFRAALDNERRAYGMYRLFLGEEHQATINSSNSVKQLMKMAVEQGKTMVAEEKKRREEEAARALAIANAASGEAAAAEISSAEPGRKTDKKKKNQGKKKKKN